MTDFPTLENRLSAIEIMCDVSDAAPLKGMKVLGAEAEVTLPTRRLRELLEMAWKGLETMKKEET